MRISSFLVLIFIFNICYSGEKSDTARAKLKFNGSLSLNSNGIAPVPSFSLDKPAIMGAFNLTWNRFSYDPLIAYGLDMQPWIIDNWLHYRIINRPSFQLRTGVDFSMFFSEYNDQDYKVLQGQQYIAFEIAAIYKVSTVSSFSFMYWNDNGQGDGTIRGHFFDLVYDRSDINAGKFLHLSVNCQLFYINYTGNNDGLFISPRIAASYNKVPVSIFFQATQALASNIEPFPGFKWNLGMAYSF